MRRSRPLRIALAALLAVVCTAAVTPAPLLDTADAKKKKKSLAGITEGPPSRAAR
jgi:hypothetical protein